MNKNGSILLYQSQNADVKSYLGYKRWTKLYMKHKLHSNPKMTYEILNLSKKSEVEKRIIDTSTIKILPYSKGYAIFLKNFENVKIPKNVIPKLYEDVDFAYRFQLTFYHFPTSQFFGRTFKSELASDMEESNETMTHIIENVSFEQTMVYFHSPIIDPNVYVVIEIIVMILHEDVTLKEVSLGFGLLNVFNPLNYGRASEGSMNMFERYFDNDEGSVVENTPVLTRKIFQGTPRILFCVENENDLLQSFGSTVNFTIFRHKKMDKIISLLEQNDFYDENDIIPGLQNMVIQDDDKQYKIPTLENPVLSKKTGSKTAIVKIDTIKLELPSKMEEKMLSDLENVRDKFESNDETVIKSDKSAQIVERKLKIGIHSTCTFIGDIKEISLQVSKSKKDNNQLEVLELSFKGSLEFDEFVEHSECAIVIELQYTVKIPQPVKLISKRKLFKKKIVKKQPDKEFFNQNISIGYYVFLPFHRKKFSKHVKCLMLTGVKGKALRSFFGNLLFVPPTNEKLILRMNILGLDKVKLEDVDNFVGYTENDSEEYDDYEVSGDGDDDLQLSVTNPNGFNAMESVKVGKSFEKKDNDSKFDVTVEKTPVKKRKTNLKKITKVNSTSKTKKKQQQVSFMGHSENPLEIGREETKKLSLTYKNLKPKHNIKSKTIPILSLFEKLNDEENQLINKTRFPQIEKEVDEDKRNFGSDPISSVRKKFYIQFLALSSMQGWGVQEFPEKFYFQLLFHFQDKKSKVLKFNSKLNESNKCVAIKAIDNETFGDIVTFDIDENLLLKEEFNDFNSVYMKIHGINVSLYDKTTHFRVGYFFIPMNIFESFKSNTFSFTVFEWNEDPDEEMLGVNPKGRICVKVGLSESKSLLTENKLEIEIQEYEKKNRIVFEHQIKVFEMDLSVKKGDSKLIFFENQLDSINEERGKREKESIVLALKRNEMVKKEFKKIFVSLGHPSFFNIILTNISNHNETYSISFEDKFLSIPNSVEELNIFKNYKNQLINKKTQHLCYIDLKSISNIEITFKYFLVEELNTPDKSTESIIVIKNLNGEVVKELVLSITQRPVCITQNFDCYSSESSFFTKKMKYSESKDYILSSNEDVRIMKPDEKNCFVMFSEKKPANVKTTVYILFYYDENFLKLNKIWRIDIYSLKHHRINTIIGERNTLALKKFSERFNEFLKNSPNGSMDAHSNDKKVLNCKFNDTRASKINQLLIFVKTFSLKEDSVLVHYIGNNEIVERHLFVIAPTFVRKNEKEFFTKRFHMKIKRKKNHFIGLPFTNLSDIEEFNLDTNHPELANFIDPKISVKKNEKTKIQMKLFNLRSKQKISIIVFINDVKFDKTIECFEILFEIQG